MRVDAFITFKGESSKKNIKLMYMLSYVRLAAMLDNLLFEIIEKKLLYIFELTKI